MSLNNDIIMAQKVLSISGYNLSRNFFNEYSPVYKSANEKLDSIKKYYKNKKDVLSVIASGDQILNFILMGSKNIYGFDITNFASYFTDLKIAAIYSLSYDEYLDMFFDTKEDNDYYDDLFYNKIIFYLPANSNIFWASIFNYFDWKEIYNSTLFSSEYISKEFSIQNNPYLEKENYNLLKNKLNNVTINYETYDILKMYPYLKNEYDLIYLSNIWQYNDIRKYLEMIDNLPIKENGSIITYTHLWTNDLENVFGKPEKKIDGNAIVLHKKKDHI